MSLIPFIISNNDKSIDIVFEEVEQSNKDNNEFLDLFIILKHIIIRHVRHELNILIIIFLIIFIYKKIKDLIHSLKIIIGE